MLELLPWAAFLAFVLAMLAVDLGVFHRNAHEVHRKEALAWSAVWIGLAIVFNIGVYGTESSVRNDKVFAPKLFPGQNAFMTVPCALPDSGDVAHHPFQGEVTHFVDCILENKKPFPNLDDAAKTMAVCIAADVSSAEGRPVKTSEV